MTLKKWLNYLGKKYPRSLAEVWDHVGYQTGLKNMNAEIHKIFLCLDFTETCFAAAKAFDPDLILTHHPFFFGRRKKILLEDYKKAKLEEEILAQLHCPIYSFHTNFDIAKGGMNDVLLDYLKLNGHPLNSNPMMRMVQFEEGISTVEFAKILANKFHFSHLNYIDNNKLNHKIVFLAGGAGNDFMDAVHEKADLYVSGDAAHHARLDMARYSLNYIELYHECEEVLFLKGMKETLLEKDHDLLVEDYAYEKIMELCING